MTRAPKLRMAFFGGSFNPPHCGHAAIVKRLIKAKFDLIFVSPVAAHPFPKNIVAYKHRHQMLALLLREFGNKVRILNWEQRRLPEPSYTVRTLQKLRENFPGASIELVMGSDSLEHFTKWLESGRIKMLASLFVFGRKGHAKSDLPEISSTELRTDPKKINTRSGLTSWQVADYISEHELYLDQNGSGA